MASTRLGYLAVGPEATLPPTITVKNPTNFLRFKDGDINKALTIVPNNPIQNQRWNAIEAVQTTEESEGTYNVDLDPNECVHWLRVALGSMVTTDISSATDASVFRHRLNMANKLPSLTIEQGKGNLDDTTNNLQNYQVDRAFGAMVNSFSISAADDIINMEINLMTHGVFQMAKLVANAAAGSSVELFLDTVEGLLTTDTVNIYDNTPQNETDAVAAIDVAAKSIDIATLGNSYTVAALGKVELVPKTPSYAIPSKVFSFKHVAFQFGDDLTAAASAAEENIEDWTLTYENNLESRFGSLRASPSVIAPKGAKAMLTFTKYFENVEDRDRYLRSLERACIITITDDSIVSATDTNNAKNTIQIKLNKVIYNTHDMPTGTDELYAINVEAEAYYSEDDGKAIEIDVINGRAGTIYTA